MDVGTQFKCHRIKVEANSLLLRSPSFPRVGCRSACQFRGPERLFRGRMKETAADHPVQPAGLPVLPNSAPFTNHTRLEATPSSMNHARRTVSHQCCTWQLPRSQTWHTHRGDCTEPQPRGTHVTRELGSIWHLGPSHGRRRARGATPAARELVSTPRNCWVASRASTDAIVDPPPSSGEAPLSPRQQQGPGLKQQCKQYWR